ncbi:MAG: hypothetical protein ACRCXZ_01605 [Patescibacteria group bacterium]
MTSRQKPIQAPAYPKDLSRFVSQVQSTTLDYAIDPIVEKAAQAIVDAHSGTYEYATRIGNEVYICLYDGPRIQLNSQQVNYIKEQFQNVLKLRFVWEPTEMYNQSGYAVYISNC